MRSRTPDRARTTPAARRDRRARPRLEGFEDRLLLATIVANDVTQLRAAIDAANVATTPTTIRLVAGGAYAVSNVVDAYNNGLPVINTKQPLTIDGSGATIYRSGGDPARLMDVAGGQVTLKQLNFLAGYVNSVASTNSSAPTAGAGLRVTGGAVTGLGLTFERNSVRNLRSIGVDAMGGAIYVGGNASLTLADSEVSKALIQSSAAGGAIYVDQQATLSLSNTNIIDNDRVLAPVKGGGLYNAGTTSIVGGTFQGNLADAGGAIYNVGSLTISGTDIEQNQAIGGARAGGGIYNAGTANISGGSISSNTATQGAGIYSTGSLNISGSVLSGNQASGTSAMGGGIYLSGGRARIDGSTIANNSAVGSSSNSPNQPIAPTGYDGSPGASGPAGGDGLGGGIYVTNAASDVRIANSSVTGNAATGGNGGRGGNGGDGGIAGVDFETSTYAYPGRGGRGGDGGAGGDAAGGGLYLSSGNVTLLQSLLAGNTASAGSGGAGGSGGDGGRGNRSLPLAYRNPGRAGDGGNGASPGSASGGGLSRFGGTLSVLNTTVAGNSVAAAGPGGGGAGGSGYPSNGSAGSGGAATNQSLGGGIYSTNSATATDLTLTAATVANNFLLLVDAAGTQAGPGLYLSGGSVATIGNSLFAGNYYYSPSSPFFPYLALQDLVGTVVSRGSNLVSDGRYGLNFAASDQVGTSAGFIDARLGPLQDNGGPTLTMALGAGSPAINAGNNALNVTPQGQRLDTDQRGAGYRRSSQGTADIGAYEVLVATGLVADGTAGTQAATVGTRYGRNPTAVVFDAGLRAPNTFVTFTAPSTGASGTFGNGQTTIRVAADANGVADPGPFTANNVAGSYMIQAVADGGPSATFRFTNAAIATSISAVTGSAVLYGPVQVSATLATPAGPLANQVVTFATANASVTATTDANGFASAALDKATYFGSVPFTVTFAGTAQYAAARFSGQAPVAAYGAPTQVRLGYTGSPVAAGNAVNAGAARVVDLYGNPVPGVVVAFAAPAAAGSFPGATTATTDANGFAVVPAFATNLVAGTYAVTATVPSLPALGSASIPFSITQATSATGGVALTAVRNGTGTLTARVTNASAGGKAVAGATVTFSLGGAVYGSAITDAAGVATLAYTGGSPQSIAAVRAATAGTGGYTASSAAGTITILANDVPAAVAPVAGAGLTVPIGGTLATPPRVRVTDRFGNPVPSAGVTFSAPAAAGRFDGDTLTAGLSSVTVATDADGVAVAPTFRASQQAGSYTISAAVSGVATPARLALTVARATVSSTVALDRGAAGTVALATAADGLRLLPAGRSATLPWLNLRRLTITLDAAAPLAAGDIRVTGVNVADYGPVSVSGSGATYTLTLARPIDGADRVTVTIGNASIAPFTRRLDVLPGDLNDDGAVTQADVIGIRNQYLGFSGAVPTASGDVNGDGVVNLDDYNEARRRVGTVLA